MRLTDVVYDYREGDRKIELSQLVNLTEFSDLVALCAEFCIRKIENLTNEGRKGSQIDEPDIRNLFDLFVRASTRLKHQGFREEREVRIVACPSDEDLIQKVYETSGAPLPKGAKYKSVLRLPRTERLEKSYIRLFDQNHGSRLPIARVIIGPHRDQVGLIARVKRLTEGRVKVVCSETPFIG